MNHTTMNTLPFLTRRSCLAALLAAMAALTLPLGAHAASVEESVNELQRDWEVIRYQTPVEASVKSALNNSRPRRTRPAKPLPAGLNPWCGRASS